MALVIDGVFSAASLRAQSTPEGYAAGEAVADLVEGVFVEAGRAGGILPAMAPTIVVIEWSRGRLRNSCPCRRRGVTTLCEHVVAVGLAALDHARTYVVAPQPVELSPMQQWLAELTAVELRSLVIDLAATGPDAQRLLDARAGDATGDTSPLEDGLLELVEETLVPGDYLDDADSVMVAEDALGLLDDLEAHLDEGRADPLLAPLRATVTLLRDVQESADDGAGALLEASERAAALYARACREGHPDGADLARWLAQFRAESMVGPRLTLETFAPAFDDAAMAAYRTAVATEHLRRGRTHPAGRREIERMVLELADHDGDIETAMAVLGHTDNPPYGAMLARLDAAGRVDEALRVVDHAVAAGRVSLRRNGFLDESRVLDPGDVGFRYLAAGRPDDALRALRGVFEREPSDASYQALLGCASRVNAYDEQRDWAMQRAHERIGSDGHAALLVTLLLAEGDVDGALAAADEHGVGPAWADLAEAIAETDPARAAELHRPALESALAGSDKRSYEAVASVLVAMRHLYEAAGTRAAFDAEIRQLRATYKRRTLMMTAFNRSRLPR